MIYSSRIWPFMGAVLYSLCLTWCGAIVVFASGRSGTSWWMTMTTFVAKTPKKEKKTATNRSLISSNPSYSFHKSVTIKSNESSTEWRTQLESLWCVFYPQKSIHCPYIPNIFAQWRVDMWEQFIMFCLMNYICRVLNNFIIVPEMLVSPYAKQNIVAKPQKTTCRS